MKIRPIEGLKNKYLPSVFLALFILIGFASMAQINPVNGTVSNKSYSPAQAVPTDFRSQFYDASNFIMRDYNGTTEVLTYLTPSKFRAGHYPIYVHSGGTLNPNGSYSGGVTLVYWFKDGVLDANLVRWGTDTVNLSGFLQSVNNLSDLQSLSTAKVNLGINNVDNTSDATKNAATATLTNKTISGANNTISGLPNSALNNSSIGFVFGTSGSDFGFTGSPVPLGGNITLNFPVAGPGVTGKLSGSDWAYFNSKLSNITGLFAGGSGYTLNGLGTSGSPYSLTITGGGGGSCLGCNADSLKNLPVDTSLRRNGYALTFDSTNHKWVLAPNGAGTGITALTGDGTASGSGSVVFTLTTVNGAPGSFGSASSVPVFTVNGKGLVPTVTNTSIQIAESQVTNLITDLAGKQATGNYITGLTGDIVATGPGSVSSIIQANAVTTSKINNNAVTYAKFQASSQAALLGTNAAGNFGEITLGTGLSFTGSVLNATGGGSQTLTYTQLALNNTLSISGGNTQTFLVATHALAGLMDSASKAVVDSLRLRTYTFPSGSGLTAGGGFSPLFTNTVTGSTLNFVASNAAANSAFGNFTGSPAPAAFGKLPLAAMATGTANSLIGYDGSGNASVITAGTNVSISAGIISASTGSTPLTFTQIGFGGASNTITGNPKFFYDSTNHRSYVDTSLILKIRFKTDTLNGAKIVFDTYQHDTATSPGNHFGDFSINQGKNVVNADGQFDYSLDIGYNILPGGTRKKASEAAWSTTLESHWLQPFPQFEYYQQMTLYGGKTIRPTALYINKTTGFGNEYHDIPVFHVRDNDTSTNHGLDYFYADATGQGAFVGASAALGITGANAAVSITPDVSGNARYSLSGAGSNIFDKPVTIEGRSTNSTDVLNLTNMIGGAQIGLHMEAGNGGGSYNFPIKINMGFDGGIYSSHSNTSGAGGAISVFTIGATGNASMVVFNNLSGPKQWYVGQTPDSTFHLAYNSTAYLGSGFLLNIDAKGRTAIGVSAPNASASLDVQGTARGVLLPRLTTTQQNAISSPATGLTIYNTDSLGLVDYNGTAWLKERAGGGTQTLTYAQLATTNTLSISGGNTQTFLTATSSLAGLLDTGRAKSIDSLRNGIKTFNLYFANGLTASTVIPDSAYWGGTLNQPTSIAGAGFPISLGTSGSNLGGLSITGGKYNSTQGSEILGVASTINNAITAASGTVTSWSSYAFLAPTVTSTNASVTYTIASTLYVDAAPTGGTNSSISNSYALNINSGLSHFGVGGSNFSAIFDGGVYINGGTKTNTYPLSLGASTTSASAYHLDPGVDVTSPVPGMAWYNGTNYYFVSSTEGQVDLMGGTRNYRHTIFAPTTGGTVNLINKQYNIINPAGALVAVTLNLPSNPSNNDVVYIKFTQTISTVTYANGTVVDGITAPTAGGLVVLTYDSGSTSWY